MQYLYVYMFLKSCFLLIFFYLLLFAIRITFSVCITTFPSKRETKAQIMVKELNKEQINQGQVTSSITRITGQIRMNTNCSHIFGMKLHLFSIKVAVQYPPTSIIYVLQYLERNGLNVSTNILQLLYQLLNFGYILLFNGFPCL